MIALGVFSAFMNYRSWGGVLMLSAAFLSIPAVLRLFGLQPKPLSYSRMLVIGTVLLATGFGAIKLYGLAAESGMLGERSREKYETQSALGDLGILLGGRSESLVTVQAIQDSPIIGHGSWAKDRYYADLRQLMLYRLGFVNRFIEPENDLIPTHSHLLGSWVEAGVGGALFWLGILALIAAALRRLYASDDPLRPYLVFLMFLFIWDILFSPFGAQRRLTNGFLMVALLFALNASAMAWRQRRANAAPSLASDSAAVMQTADPMMRPGLAEAPARAWLAQARHQTFGDSDADHGRRGGPEVEPVEGTAARELRAADDNDNKGDDRRGTTDIGAGGETIRAGFRRLRQRDR
jgi:O-antigen ligase